MVTKKKKERIIKLLKESKKEWGDPVSWHIDNIIKDFNEDIKYDDSRRNIYNLTGIKLRKVGKFIF